MKKKETEIATNTSSGAEKVEKIQKEIKENTANGVKTQTTKTTKKNTAKTEAALGNGENKVNKPAHGLAEKEAAVAKARVEVALTKKQIKEQRKQERMKKLAEKKARAEKRLAEKKAQVEKHLAEKKARIEKKKAEREAMIRERAHEKANKNQAKHKKQVEKTRKTNEKKEKRQNNERNKGYGGWLAATIALSAVTLALTTAVTVGGVEMSKAKKGMMSAHRGTMYELTGIMEHVDDDLERARISASPAQQSRILTDLLVQARLAEVDLERLPISAEADMNVTVFLNRTAAQCERMLQKLRYGGELDEEDFKTLEGLYKTNHSIRQELDALMEKMTDKDLMAYLKDGAGSIGDMLKRLEEMTLEENRAMFEKGKEKIEKEKDKPMPLLQEREKKEDEKDGKLSPTEAEKLCEKYFSDYKIKDFQCVGETTSKKIMAYNVQGYDEKGTLLFAEISKNDGALIKFDYYENCSEDTFDIRNAERIAEEFLDKLGYDDMEVVRYKENGTMTDFVFVYEDDDVAYYPDEVRVKICRSRGVVTGFDASKYLENHKERKEVEPRMSLGEAKEKLHKNLTVESSRLAVLKAGKGERAAYEFLCGYENELYFVYVDANSGEEIAIINARTVS